MNNEASLLCEIENNINNGQIDKALKKLESGQFSSIQETRKAHHLKSKVSLYTGDYNQCIRIIDETQAVHGKYIGLLADKCCALYLMGDYLRWQLCTQELENEFNRCHQLLEKSCYIKTLTCLAKFKEELGHIHEALSMYDHLLSLLDKLVDDYPMTLAQIVRLKAKWQLKDKLPSLYKDLFSINSQRYHNNFNIELHHALLTSELELFGIDFAKERLAQVRPLLESEDLALFVSEIIEYELRSGLPVSKELVLLLQENISCPYEQALVSICKKEEITIPTMPLHSHLSLYLIMLRSNTYKSTALAEKVTFLISDLSAKTQQLWNLQITTNTELEMILSCSKLKYLKNECDLKKKKVALKIVEAFCDNREITHEKLCNTIWSAQYNESYYHRIRVAVKRLNTLISQTFNIPDIIELDSSKVTLNKSVKLSTN